MKAEKNLIIVGDRVLIDPDEGIDKRSSGLYLPPTVREKEKVLGGYIVKTGPGYPVHDPTATEERWAVSRKKELKYVPLQAVGRRLRDLSERSSGRDRIRREKVSHRPPHRHPRPCPDRYIGGRRRARGVNALEFQT